MLASGGIARVAGMTSDVVHEATALAGQVEASVEDEADTLDEIWPTAQPFGPYPWLNPDIAPDDTRPVRPEGR